MAGFRQAAFIIIVGIVIVLVIVLYAGMLFPALGLDQPVRH